jgi:hypothetical protein
MAICASIGTPKDSRAKSPYRRDNYDTAMIQRAPLEMARRIKIAIKAGLFKKPWSGSTQPEGFVSRP